MKATPKALRLTAEQKEFVLNSFPGGFPDSDVDAAISAPLVALLLASGCSDEELATDAASSSVWQMRCAISENDANRRCSPMAVREKAKEGNILLRRLSKVLGLKDNASDTNRILLSLVRAEASRMSDDESKWLDITMGGQAARKIGEISSALNHLSVLLDAVEKSCVQPSGRPPTPRLDVLGGLANQFYRSTKTKPIIFSDPLDSQSISGHKGSLVDYAALAEEAVGLERGAFFTANDYRKIREALTPRARRVKPPQKIRVST